MSCFCPDNYFFNPETDLCERIVKTDATLNPYPQPAANICGSHTFMVLGALYFPSINSDQFPLIGNTEMPPQYVDSNSTVINKEFAIITPMYTSGGSAFQGRLNQAGVGLLPPTGNWQGYSRCITVLEEQTYTLAIAADNGFRVYIDGILAIYYKPSGVLYPASYMHIFPLDLSLGKHNILVEAISIATESRTCKDVNGFDVNCSSLVAVIPPNTCPNMGVFVMELYLNVTPAILNDVQNQQELNDLYARSSVNNASDIITTAVLRGNPFDTGVNGNYTCSEGALMSCEEGRVVCVSKLTTPKIECCFNLINCQTGAELLTNSNLTAYLSKVIKIEEAEGCFLINYADPSECSSEPNVTVTSYYGNCIDCNQVYYRLIDCTGQATPIVTKTDLGDYIGKVVKIAGYNVCWIVGNSEQSSSVEVEVVQNFETCENCL